MLEHLLTHSGPFVAVISCRYQSVDRRGFVHHLGGPTQRPARGCRGSLMDGAGRFKGGWMSEQTWWFWGGQPAPGVLVIHFGPNDNFSDDLAKVRGEI